MKNFKAIKLNRGKDVLYISNESEYLFTNDESYLMAVAEAVEEIKKEFNAEGLQIHPSCVEFQEDKAPLISGDFTKYDDAYMEFIDGERRYPPHWEQSGGILLKDNKENYYCIYIRSHWFSDLQMIIDEDFVETDDDYEPCGEGAIFIDNLRDNSLVDHNKDMSFIEMEWFPQGDDIHEYLARHSYVEGDIVKVLEEEPTILNEWKSRCEYKPIEWIDLNSLNIA